MPATDDASLLRDRIRRWTWFLILGLVISGATAIPIPTQFAIARRIGVPVPLPEPVTAWLRTLGEGIDATVRDAPFMFYGTDWLGFGHFVIALAFVGALRDPVRNRWLYAWAMLACLAVPPWALVFGAIRGIPWWWRLIDASFGIVGFVPAYLCHRWTGQIELETP